MTSPKLKLHSNEKYVVLPIRKTPKGYKYAITNYGRVISFTEEPKTGRFLKAGVVSGYPSIALRVKDQNTTFLIHRLVATHFVNQPDKKHKFVMHVNYNKNDNYYSNLKWATQEKKTAHINKNPEQTRIGYSKLTPARVLQIKRILLKGNTQLKTIADKFGVSDMQIHRIKTGENWGHLKL